MNSKCRLCGDQSPSLKSIFSLQNGRLVCDLIILICPIKIDVKDSLPHQICSRCLLTIIESVTLREKSVQNDINFRSSISQQQEPSPLKITDVKIKMERDPINSGIVYEDESVNNYEEEESEAETNDNSDDDDFAMISYEPRAKRAKGVRGHLCKYCNRLFRTQIVLANHLK